MDIRETISDNIKTPEDQINNAIGIFTLALRLHCSVRSDRIGPAHFIGPIKINTGGIGVNVRAQDYTPQELNTVSYNLFIASMGVVAGAIDRALDELFGPKDSKDKSDVGSLRAIIYMIRCAFAHDPLNPRWCCSGKYQNIYSMEFKELGLIQFDGKTCNGLRFTMGDFGGLEAFVQMINKAHEIAATRR